ncbi:MAG TPA: hypothetical protein VFS05_15740, partial [Gemmatimonadaceae bacterium]|nr:hypothetical protein [Gemmatimonadaceae bacterium]
RDAAAATTAGAPIRSPAGAQVRAPADTGFARLVERLSEPGGYFDTDNLISNESSYLHVLGPIRALGVSGGAYIGVGPDQNFSYIAQIRPRIAFLIDIRRDNLLQHLMFRALFEAARTRVEYLALLHGRRAPDDWRAWRDRPLRDILAYIDSTPSTPRAAARARAAVHDRVRGYGVPLSTHDLETIGRFHDEFIAQGLDLRFTSFNRAPRPYYPTYRQLLEAKDLTGREGSYVAREEDFQFVRQLEARGLVVPVVGDLAGPHALAAIGREIAARGETVSALYTSNVEFYLVRDGSFDRFAATAAALPRTDRSVIIRSFFGGTFGAQHPHAVPGFMSTQTLQTLASFARALAGGGYQSYWELVTRDAIDPRPPAPRPAAARP